MQGPRADQRARPPRLARQAAALAGMLMLGACGAGLQDTGLPTAAGPGRAVADAAAFVPAAQDRGSARSEAPSGAVADYLRAVQDALRARGLLRTDDLPGKPDAARLVEDFVQIALRDEYTLLDGQLIPQAHPAPLRRWDVPVRLSVEFGASVPDGQRRRDRADIARFATRLGRATAHPVSVVPDDGNFVALILSEDERRAIGPRLAQLVPGIPPGDIAAIESMAPQTYCTVFAYSPGGSAAYTAAVAVIRAELPQPLRISCLHEELAQGVGLANDSPDARPSIFNDDEEFALLTRHDELLLRMLYDPRLRPGMTESEARPIAARIAAELTR